MNKETQKLVSSVGLAFFFFGLMLFAITLTEVQFLKWEL